jgi:hypothetical protein
MPDNAINRRLVKLAHARATEEPVILLEGLRASGKSTAIRAPMLWPEAFRLLPEDCIKCSFFLSPSRKLKKLSPVFRQN